MIRNVIAEHVTYNDRIKRELIYSSDFYDLELDLEKYMNEQMSEFLDWALKSKPIAKTRSELIEQFKSRK